MKISKLGEFGLIDLIKRMSGSSASVIKGIGDDCAVLPFNSRKLLLLTSDMLVQDIDFTRRDKLYSVGRKSLGVCLSDIAACGGSPRYAQVSLGLPVNMAVSQVKQLYRGIISQAEKFAVKIVGGDTSRSDKLVIDTTMLGFVEPRNLILRQGARKGDIIFVSGRLGGSIYGRHLAFTPRIKEARYLVRNFKVNSMIDISDGLLQDLGHILKQSNKGAVIFEDLIPVSSQARSFQDALFMGEDFELLFTLPVIEARRLLKLRRHRRPVFLDTHMKQRKFKKGMAEFMPIGEIVDKSQGLVLLSKQGRKLKYKPDGFRHF